MTQPINVDDVLEVTAEGVNEGVNFAIVRHFLVVACASPSALLTAIHTSWETTIAISLSSVCTDKWEMQCTSISRVAPTPMNVSFHNFASPVVGDINSDAVPNQAAVLVRLLTSEVGARNRGRVYLCGCPEADTNAGRLTATGLGLWQSAAAVFGSNIDDSAGNIATPCIFSRTQYAANPAAAASTYTAVIDSIAVQANIAVIRRRRYPRSVPG